MGRSCIISSQVDVPNITKEEEDKSRGWTETEMNRNQRRTTAAVWLCYVGVVRSSSAQTRLTGERNETEQELKRESVHDGDRLKEDAAL